METRWLILTKSKNDNAFAVFLNDNLKSTITIHNL
jgi:hypothetical protein